MTTDKAEDTPVPVEEWAWAQRGRPKYWSRNLCYVCGGNTFYVNHVRCNASMRAFPDFWKTKEE